MHQIRLTKGEACQDGIKVVDFAVGWFCPALQAPKALQEVAAARDVGEYSHSNRDIAKSIDV